MKVKVFTCGGTFEKIYNPLNGLLEFYESFVPDLVRRSRITMTVDFEPLFLKDSLDMSDDDRKIISTKVKMEQIQNIVLIHGTDTMVETAKVIKDDNPDGKVIVLTGAMVPYSIKDSDAMFNFGSAFAAAQLLSPGVWISMNGTIFNSDDVQKNRSKGLFETL